MKKILVTSSTGITGRAVVRHLAESGAHVRAMIHSARHASGMMDLGASETMVASVDDAADMRRAMADIDAVFYICPTAHPQEGEIGVMAADIAVEKGIHRFVYQSVHNSIEPGLIHHRQKLMIEQHLLESGLEYTILRPAAFMQNILANIGQIMDQHMFAQRFFTVPTATNRINLIDVEDYAEIASKVTLDDSFAYAQLDLCGPRNLSAQDMLESLSHVAGAEVSLRYITDDEFIRMSESRNMPRHTLDVLLAMFRSYNRYGFLGNPYETSSLLGRSPQDFDSFLTKAVTG